MLREETASRSGSRMYTFPVEKSRKSFTLKAFISCIYFDLRSPALTLHETGTYPYLHRETSNRTHVSTPAFRWNGPTLDPDAMTPPYLTPNRLEILLSRFAGLSVMVVGDFFLDKYLVLDPWLDEPSLETGLDARQVVDRRCLPGAAGTVTANLRALGVGRLFALGVTGDDGEGYELRQGLTKMGARLEGLFESGELFTPTYIKPMVRSPDGEAESNRIDIQNRAPLSRTLEDRIIAYLGDMAPAMDGLVVLDQVGRRNAGVVTDRVREAIGDLGRAYPDRVILADSRERIGEFRHVIRKGNRDEVRRAAQTLGTVPTRVFDEKGAGGEARSGTEGARNRNGIPDREEAERWGRVLFDSGCVDKGSVAGDGTPRPVFVTLGAEGLLLIDGDGCRHMPGIRVPDPVDTVGAGDSVTAGIVASLAAGASHAEAGLVGNLAASATVRQLGVTGTASPGQLLEALKAMS